MLKDRELERLKKEIAQEKKKFQQQSNIAKKIKLKQELKRELFELKNPKKFTLGRRLKKGLKITGGKFGKAILKQGRLIKEQQEREQHRERKHKRLPKLTKKRKSSGGFNPFGELDF